MAMYNCWSRCVVLICYCWLSESCDILNCISLYVETYTNCLCWLWDPPNYSVGTGVLYPRSKVARAWN